MVRFCCISLLFLALNANAQNWKCVETECSNGSKSFSMAEAVTEEGRIPPPSEIDVDGDTYSLRVRDYLGPVEKDGRTLVGTTTVAIRAMEVKSGQKLEDEKDSVWHECTHAAFGSDTADLIGKKWSEEQAVYKLTPKLLKIIERNPKLLEYLTQP